jgi:C4-dicarboxylate transporter DctM subunit
MMAVVTAVAFVVLLILAVPVAFTVGMSAVLGILWSGRYPLTTVLKQTFEGVDSFVLLAIPLFILAGALMETGGIAVRLVRLAQALVGRVRGGLSMAVVVAEYIFSGISGSTVADVSAIGSTMIPPMLRAGYRKEQAVAIVSAASAMGILVPPCILMIVIGSVASVSVAALFAAGFLPAVVLALAIMGWIYYDAGRSGIDATARMSARQIGVVFVDALIPLGLPVIIFGGILGGVVTPTEAAVIAVIYAFVVGIFVYREIKWADVPGILVTSAVVTASVCFLLGTAGVVAWVLVVEQVPQLLLNAMLAVPGGATIFLMLTAVLFIALGAVLEGLPAVVILLPTFLPVVKQLGIDVIHYSTVVVAATGIGLFLPPIGVGFFIACGIAKVSVDRATGAMMPYIVMMCIALLVVIVVPWVTLVLPRLLRLN